MSVDSTSKPDEPLMIGEDDFLAEPRRRQSTQSRTRSLIRITVAVLAAVLLFGLGVVAGKHVPTRPGGLLAPSGNVKVFMEYNSTFTLQPSVESNAAWDALFPTGKGFVKHPSIAPETSGLVVYHALHCLNALREVYYTAVDGKLSHMPDEHDHQTDPHHVRHCLDYLRQSLMCSADTNLEPVTRDVKGVTGWGFTRTCRDWDGVKAWAEKNWSNDL